jgi:hypothetical protein
VAAPGWTLGGSGTLTWFCAAAAAARAVVVGDYRALAAAELARFAAHRAQSSPSWRMTSYPCSAAMALRSARAAFGASMASRCGAETASTASCATGAC